jgi:hypothetical protein
MRRIVLSVACLLVVVSCHAQTQVTDMKALVGKKAVAQRMPFYQPGTYQAIPNTYAGQTITIIEVKPSAMYAGMPALTAKQMASLPPQSRQAIENVRNAVTVVVQFADGTKADTGAMPVMPSTLPSYLELIADPAAAGVAVSASSGSLVRATLTSAASSKSNLLIQPPGTLPEDEVELALNGTGRGHAVYIMDGGTGAPSLTPLVASITLYMPDAILAMRSASAKAQFTKYVPSEEDKQLSLTITAHGSAGSTIAEGCTSITRVVLLSDPSGSVVKEAYLSEPLAQVWRNGYGATNECDDLRAKFSLEDVHQVKNAASNGEFFVAVFSGAVNTKMYKVKNKYQAKLALK